ncbi:hypothetical protein TWF730_009515 [Orbilia blumenaviensis]|uniref:C2H2-type domain-containing protein n=1 Tax=Orbilia blumenaviensis TaxID=1796055 RepID=A0AAV9UW60_9PEZI
MERSSQGRGNTWSLNSSRLPRPLPPLTSEHNATRRDEKIVDALPGSMDHQTEKGPEYSLPSISSLLFYATNGSDRSLGTSHSNSISSARLPESSMQDFASISGMSPARRTSWSENMSLNNSWRGVCQAEAVGQRHKRLDQDLDLHSNPDTDRNNDYGIYSRGFQEESTLEPPEIPTASQPWTHHHHSAPSTSLSSTQNLDRYVCSQCTKTFSRPSSLRIHSHSHTGEKPFVCPHSGCGKAFSVRSNMKRHERGCHSTRG